MVYATAARKTASFMVISLVLSLAIILFTTSDFETPTGRVVSAGTAQATDASSWAIFFLGVVAGAIIVGTYTYLVHIEAKRKE